MPTRMQGAGEPDVMANDTDFLSLYQELGVHPDNGLPALRQAYRRRVSQLHPDRRADAIGTMRNLQRLNTLYSAAVEFEQRHGRLPGSAQTVPLRPSTPARPILVMPGATHDTVSRRRWHLRILPIGIVGLLALLYARFDEPVAPDDPVVVADHREAMRSPMPPPRAEMLDLGMEASDVLEIEGEPISRSSSLWEYGPSWIGFECELVSDWYSSPMRPLKVATQRPKPRENDEPVSRIRCAHPQLGELTKGS
jgi:hypothetical protein